MVVAYGRIIPEAVLERCPMVNLHFSLLPRWRGAAPVERAILEGDAETGVCLMAVEPGLDTGGIYARWPPRSARRRRPTSCGRRLVAIGCALLDEHLAARARRPAVPPRDQRARPRTPRRSILAELELHWEETRAPDPRGS